GTGAAMTFRSFGRRFGLGSVAAIEQAGLLVGAGALVGALVIRQPLPGPAAAVAGVLAGLGGSAAGGLALLQPAGRAIGLALTVLIVHAVIAPSPLAVAAASVVKADIATMLWIAGPAAIAVASVGWMLFSRCGRGAGALP